MTEKPAKPTPDFPLFAHSSGQWAKKIGGKMFYFGKWDDAQAALAKYQTLVTGKKQRAKKAEPRAELPALPYPDFPLSAHPNGQWCKKINGKLYYFGVWADPQAAVDRFLERKDDLLAGREPTCYGDGMTIRELADRFLTTKQSLRDSGRITPSHYRQLDENIEFAIKFFGPGRRIDTIRPIDFEDLYNKFPTTWGTRTVYHVITRIRSLFNYANDQEYTERPIKFGKAFSRPGKKELRIDRAKKPKKKFEPAEIRAAIDAATPAMKAMILLGINAGFGNRDCAALPRTGVLDFKRGWFDYNRQKTGTDRWGPLWPETVAALEAYAEVRPNARSPEAEECFFVTKYGDRYYKPDATRFDDPVSKEMAKLLKKLNIKRKGVGFYALRHTFYTIGEEARDQQAAKFIMGHLPAADDMGANYREEFTEDRLRHVTDHVRNWLFPSPELKVVDNQAA